jgi:hypothetical protein
MHMLKRIAVATSSLALGVLVPCANAQHKYHSFDPGHRSFVTLGDTQVSCPNGFTPVAVRPGGSCLVMRHDLFKLALFVARIERGTTGRAALDRIAAVVLKDGVSEDVAGYRWKDFNDYRKQSAFETGGGKMQGFNGKQDLGLAYRELTFGEKTFVEGYVFDLHGGADAARLFERNVGGDSLLGAIAETHVICSITGENYDDLNPNDGGVGGAPNRR